MVLLIDILLNNQHQINRMGLGSVGIRMELGWGSVQVGSLHNKVEKEKKRGKKKKKKNGIGIDCFLYWIFFVTMFILCLQVLSQCISGRERYGLHFPTN